MYYLNINQMTVIRVGKRENYDMNADGHTISTFDELEDFIETLYSEGCYSDEVRNRLLDELDDTRIYGHGQ